MQVAVGSWADGPSNTEFELSTRNKAKFDGFPKMD